MAFWDDLNPNNLDSSTGMSGEVLFYTDNSKCVVWFNNVVHWGADEPYNFQIIIYKEFTKRDNHQRHISIQAVPKRV